MTLYFFRAETAPERAAINHFLRRHNQRGPGSLTGYVAYYAAAHHEPERPLLARLVAAAKFCPLHTPQAAKFFAGEAWRHVYGLQRLAAYRAPTNLLSRFVAWCLKHAARGAIPRCGLWPDRRWPGRGISARWRAAQPASGAACAVGRAPCGSGRSPQRPA